MKPSRVQARFASLVRFGLLALTVGLASFGAELALGVLRGSLVVVDLDAGRATAPSPFHAFLYVLFFAALSLPCLVAQSILSRLRRNQGTARILLAFCATYCAGLLVTAVCVRWNAMLHSHGAEWLTVLLCAIALGAAAFLAGEGRSGRWGRAIAVLVLIAWTLFSPETRVISKLPAAMGIRLAFFVLLLTAIWDLTIRHSIGLLKGVRAAGAVLLATTLLGWLTMRDSAPPLPGDSPPGGQTDSPGPDRPNIILIVWDTVRRDHCSLYGYERATTPHLEESASSSVVYSHAIAPSSWTLPSHASMFTGLYPREHGAHLRLVDRGRHFASLNDRFETLAEVLSRAGYQCAGLSANFLMAGRAINLDQGFEYFHDSPNPYYVQGARFDVVAGIARALRDHIPARFLSPFWSPTRTADQITSLALRWIDSRDLRRPFFLFLNYMDAHAPYLPPSHLVGRFDGFQPDLAGQRPVRGFCKDSRLIKHFISQYDAGIACLDEELKRFEDGLRTRDVFDGTFLIVTSDHGEFLGEHDLLEHVSRLYAEAIEVPLTIHYPGGTPTGTETRLFETRRLFDMILVQAGLRPAEQDVSWEAVCERYGYNTGGDNKGPFAATMKKTERCVFYEGYKMIAFDDGSRELFCPSEDPHETRDLVSERGDVVAKGEALLDEFLTTTEDSGIPADQGDFDEAERKRLKDLGYL